MLSEFLSHPHISIIPKLLIALGYSFLDVKDKHAFRIFLHNFLEGRDSIHEKIHCLSSPRQLQLTFWTSFVRYKDTLFREEIQELEQMRDLVLGTKRPSIITQIFQLFGTEK